jgi:hypothetical protein
MAAQVTNEPLLLLFLEVLQFIVLLCWKYLNHCCDRLRD